MSRVCIVIMRHSVISLFLLLDDLILHFRPTREIWQDSLKNLAKWPRVKFFVKSDTHAGARGECHNDMHHCLDYFCIIKYNNLLPQLFTQCYVIVDQAQLVKNAWWTHFYKMISSIGSLDPDILTESGILTNLFTFLSSFFTYMLRYFNRIGFVTFQHEETAEKALAAPEEELVFRMRWAALPYPWNLLNLVAK